MGEMYEQNSGNFTALVLFGHVVVALEDNGHAQVWNYVSRMRLATFRIPGNTDLVKISSQFIVCGIRTEGVLVVYKNDSNYTYFVSLNLKDHILARKHLYVYIQDITFITPNLLMVTSWTGIFLVSLSSSNILDSFEFDGDKHITSATITEDGSIFTAGMKGNYSIFEVSVVRAMSL